MGGPGFPVQGAGRGVWTGLWPNSGLRPGDRTKDRRGDAARGSGRSPCSSLVAAARRVDDVLPLSVLGVPGRLLPRELPPDGLRSLLGGVFFFCRDGVGDVSADTGRPPARSGPGLGLTAMKRADDASLSMSLSSELSDSSLLSAWARGGTRWCQGARPPRLHLGWGALGVGGRLPPGSGEGTDLSCASSPEAWAPSSPPPPPCPPPAASPPHSPRCSRSAHRRPWDPPPAG